MINDSHESYKNVKCYTTYYHFIKVHQAVLISEKKREIIKYKDVLHKYLFDHLTVDFSINNSAKFVQFIVHVQS